MTWQSCVNALNVGAVVILLILSIHSWRTDRLGYLPGLLLIAVGFIGGLARDLLLAPRSQAWKWLPVLNVTIAVIGGILLQRERRSRIREGQPP